MSVEQIYDIEGIIEAAGQKVLQDLGLTAATTQDAPQFQKQRPRVELLCKLGAGLQRYAIVIEGVNVALDPSAAAGLTPAQLYALRRESAWAFTLQFRIFTDATIKTHTSYRAQVRAVLAQFWQTLNNTAPMTRHAIESPRDLGASDILIAPEEGIMRSDHNFNGTISVQANAWSALQTP